MENKGHIITPSSLRYLFILLTIVGCEGLFAGCSVRLAQHTASSGKKDTTLDLYLLIGQSNMAGRAAITPSVQDTLENVYLFTGDTWIPAVNPLNKYSSVRKSLPMQRLGPGYSFAKALADCTGRKIGLVVNARGGTALEWWEKGYTGPNDYDLYEHAVERIKKAQQYGRVKGIIWHQGEANQRRSAAYMALLKKLVGDLRKDIGERQVFFVAGEIGEWRNSSIAINRVIRDIPNEIKNAGYVSAEGLTPLKGDTTDPHFDTQSQLILGRRYADKVLRAVYHRRPCEREMDIFAISTTRE